MTHETGNKITKIDYIEAGKQNTNTPKVILFHSSVAGAKQWRKLMTLLSDHFHVISINMFGYGNTPPWTTRNTQSFKDQAMLAAQFIGTDDKIIFIGHSFGGSVAMKAASIFSENVSKLVLVEPNPFYLLKQHDRIDGFTDIDNIRKKVQALGEVENWNDAAHLFADYWNGEGSWEQMPDDRKAKFITGLQQTHFEWDALFNETATLNEWVEQLPSDTSVIWAKDTVLSIRELMSLFKKAAPLWNFIKTEDGGHMLPLTRPKIVNTIILKLLRDT